MLIYLKKPTLQIRGESAASEHLDLNGYTKTSPPIFSFSHEEKLTLESFFIFSICISENFKEYPAFVLLQIFSISETFTVNRTSFLLSETIANERQARTLAMLEFQSNHDDDILHLVPN